MKILQLGSISKVFKGLLLLMLITAFLPTMGQNPTYLCELRNDVQVDANTLEFDIYLLRTGATPFELAAIQHGIYINSALIPAGGVLTAEIVPGSSELSSTNVPTNANVSVANSNPNKTIKITGNAYPGAGSGSIISNVSPGTRFARIRVTSKVAGVPTAFVSNTANLTWSFANPPSWPSKVQAYVGGSPINITVQASHTNVNLVNMVLNPPAPSVFGVTGGGSYCQGGAGLPVGLNGSQNGVTYELWMDGSATGTTLPGTGAAISFGDQLVGTYTVKGTNGGGTTPMSGSAIISEELPVVATFNPMGPYCQGSVADVLPASSLNGFTGTWLPAAINTAVVGPADYVFTPDAGQCATGTSLTVTITAPVVPTFTQLGPYLQGDVADPLPVVSSNGINGTWSPAAINTATLGSSTYTFTPALGACATGTTMDVTINPAGPVDYAWNGTTNSWTTAGNWTPNGVPGALDNVVIGAGEVAYPTLTAPATIASLVIENGGSFIGSEFLTTGSAIVKRDLPAAEFHFVSSPLTSTTFGSAFPLNQDAVWVRAYNEPSGDWVNQVIGDNFAVGKGYSVKMDAPQTAMFSGTLNAAAVNNTLSKQNVSGEMNRVGWNLLGNPFTSAVDWDDMVKGAGVEAAVYVWNGSQYISYTGGVGALIDGVIPAQNGFFVKTSTNNASLTIPLAARVHSAIPFYKSSVDNLIELRADGNNYSDFTFVHFNGEATHGFDARFDAFKLYGINEAPQLYSMISGEILSINERPMDGNDIVQLGFSCGNSGSYTFTASGMESFDASKPIFLEDSKLNVYQDLRSNPVYGFSYIAGENANRFKLVFGSVGIGEGNALNVGIFAERKNIHVTTPESFRGTVQVYDLLGKMVAERQVSGSGETIISMAVPTATYLVKATGANGTITRKVVLN